MKTSTTKWDTLRTDVYDGSSSARTATTTGCEKKDWIRKFYDTRVHAG